MSNTVQLHASGNFGIKFTSQKSNYAIGPQDADKPEGRDFLKHMKATTTHPGETLDYGKWLPFAAKKYKISSNIEDYVVVNTPMIPSDIPNRNGVAFPLHELISFRPPPVNRLVYKAWTGCPTHEEHQADDHETALGIILDTSLVRIKNYGNGRHWMVMALLAFDKTKAVDRVGRILQGEVSTYSMGATCQYFTCGLSGVRLDDPRYSHRLKKQLEWEVVRDPLSGHESLLFRNAHELTPGECSTVDDPAWVPATSDFMYDLATQ